MGDDVYQCFPPYPNPDASIYRPNIPLWKSVPGSLVIGKIIEIKGSFSNACDVFCIDLVNYRDEGTVKSDRPLHISIRPRSKVVVRNVFKNNEWDTEERDGGYPFEMNKQFVIFILNGKKGFQIAVDGKHRWEFLHRVDFSRVSFLHIDGAVKIDEVRFREPYTDSISKYCKQPFSIYGNIKPIINPLIPYSYLFNNGLTVGQMIYISGRPTAKSNRFTFNFLCNCSDSLPEDIALHIDARIVTSALVRNTCINQKWSQEETAVPYFPFERGVFFDIVIHIKQDAFLVAVNNLHFLEYRHRVLPVSKISKITIEGDVVVSSLRFS